MHIENFNKLLLNLVTVPNKITEDVIKLYDSYPLLSKIPFYTSLTGNLVSNKSERTLRDFYIKLEVPENIIDALGLPYSSEKDTAIGYNESGDYSIYYRFKDSLPFEGVITTDIIVTLYRACICLNTANNTKFKRLRDALVVNNLLPEIEEFLKEQKKRLTTINNDEVASTDLNKLNEYNNMSDFRYLVASLGLDKWFNQELIKYFTRPDEELFADIEGLKGFKVINKRVYIPYDKTDTKYFVISRNPIDWFFASWYQRWSSCFNYNSNNADYSKFINGYIAFMVGTNGCLCYTTNGEVEKQNLTDTFVSPKFHTRFWSHPLENNKLSFGRAYGIDEVHTEELKDFVLYVLPDIFHTEKQYNGLNIREEYYNLLAENPKLFYMFYNDCFNINRNTGNSIKNIKELIFCYPYSTSDAGRYFADNTPQPKIANNVEILKKIIANKMEYDFEKPLVFDPNSLLISNIHIVNGFVCFKQREGLLKTILNNNNIKEEDIVLMVRAEYSHNVVRLTTLSNNPTGYNSFNIGYGTSNLDIMRVPQSTEDIHVFNFLYRASGYTLNTLKTPEMLWNAFKTYVKQNGYDCLVLEVLNETGYTIKSQRFERKQ